jgi:archaellum component FlaC
MTNENINARDLKEIAQVNREFNDVVKDTVNSLKNMAKSYDTILSKIDNMNKGAINTKRIQSELEKASAKAELAQQKYNQALADANFMQVQNADLYETTIKSIETQTKKLQRAIATGNSQQYQIEQSILQTLDAQLDNIKSNLDAKSLELIASRETQSIANKLTEEVRDRLSFEKQLEKSLGKTGQLVGFLNNKFGLFKDTYAKIVEEARDGNKTELRKIQLYGILTASMIGVYKLAQKIGTTLSQGIKTITPAGDGFASNLTFGISTMLEKIPLLGPILGGLTRVFSNIFDIIVSTNDLIVKSGRSLSLNTAEATRLYREYVNISYQSNDIFITSKKMLSSQVELGQALGVNNQISNSILSTNIKLKDIAGIEAGVRADIVENSIISKNTSEQTIKFIAAQVKGLKNATGISLNFQKILEEANKLGGYLGLSFAKYPEKISKAVVTTKALGTNLKDIDSLADSFLDFESSISKQFEAQLLTGRDINLQEARRLFLNNDLSGAAIEINKQLGTSDDFLKMNRISAASMAESFGMSRDQLGEMLKRQELLSILGAKDTDNARTQLKIGLQRFQSQKQLSQALGEDVYNNLVNASTQEKMAAMIDKIKTSIVDFVEGSRLIDKIQSFIDYLSNPQKIGGILNTIKNIIAGAVSFFGDLFAFVADAISYLPGTDTKKWENYASVIRSNSETASNSIKAIGIEPISVGKSALQNAVGNKPAPIIMNQPSNKNNQPVSVNIQNYTLLDSQAIAAANFKNAQSNAPLDNSVGQYQSNISYSLPGQSSN